MAGVRTLPITLAVLGAAALALAAAPARAQAAPALRPCPGQAGFDCGTLRVPLDRTGRLPGQLALRFAVQRGDRSGGVLVALTGGPGQSGVPAATQFRGTLAPLLRSRRLVVLDQRGTGRSGALDCPGIQRLGGLGAFTPELVERCADRVGPSRRSYTTQDTVADLEALRVALGARRLALMGVSYGTYVAQQYARVHPDRTARLVLDSVVGPAGVDAFGRDTLRRMGRVLREQCAGSRCAGITPDPMADVAALVRTLAAGSVRGTALDARGRRHPASLRTGEELLFTLVAGDLNPYLQAALPGALAAVRRGDTAPLVRLRAVAAGPVSPREELSGGLNVVTGCQDVRLPYALSTPRAQRRAQALAALAALDPADYAPWDPATVFSSSYVEDCLRFPDGGAEPSSAQLPDVPTLLLSGRLDLRTPMENADAVAAELPRATRVRIAGTGHDVLDADITGCAALVLERWARGRSVGTPCAGRSNAVAPFPRPPMALSEYPALRGVAGNRGRVLLATLDTVQDARIALLQRLFAGLGTAGGGLRGGSFSAPEDLSSVHLRAYQYLGGLRVSGRLTLGRDGLEGRVRVRAPGGLTGALDVDAGGASGRLGDRQVRFRERVGRAARHLAPPLRLAPRAALLRARPGPRAR